MTRRSGLLPDKNTGGATSIRFQTKGKEVRCLKLAVACFKGQIEATTSVVAYVFQSIGQIIGLWAWRVLRVWEQHQAHKMPLRQSGDIVGADYGRNVLNSTNIEL